MNGITINFEEGKVYGNELGLFRYRYGSLEQKINNNWGRTVLSLHNIANTEFTEVISPVTRHEAIDALCEKKTVVCKLHKDFYEYRSNCICFKDEENTAVSFAELREGTWYIGNLEEVKRSLEA